MKFRDFHNQSGIGSIRRSRALMDAPPLPVKEYARFPSTALPAPEIPMTPLKAAFAARHSTRAFDQHRSIALTDLSTLLYAGGGIQGSAEDRNAGTPSRHHPSGGALYPLECYVAAFRVDSLEPGIYHYHPIRSALERLPGTSESVWQSFKDEAPVEMPAAAIVLSAVWQRTFPKYGEFAYRLALFEAGHLMQDMLLSAEGQGLRYCPIAGFAPTKLARALRIERDEEDPLYLMLVGL